MNNRQKKSTILIVIAVVAVAIGIFYFSSKNKKTEIVDESVEIVFNKQGELNFIDATTNDTLTSIDIEIADNDYKRARGLMFRKSIPDNAGMLFIHDHEDILSFWMKNTYISLDMIFVNAEKKVVTIHRHTEPLKEWNYTSTKPATYVIEVNAGFCNKHGIKEGNIISYKNLEN